MRFDDGDVAPVAKPRHGRCYILDHADRFFFGTRDPAGSLKGLTATLAFI